MDDRVKGQGPADITFHVLRFTFYVLRFMFHVSSIVRHRTTSPCLITIQGRANADIFLRGSASFSRMRQSASLPWAIVPVSSERPRAFAEPSVAARRAASGFMP